MDTAPGSSSGEPPAADGDSTGPGSGTPYDTSVDLLPDDDADQDGLTNVEELALGTSPFRFDTDGDGLGDADEVGSTDEPNDADGDGRIDAIEHRLFDIDQDGIPDQEDAGEGWQLVWGGFTPRVIPNDGATATRLEVHLVGTENVERVRAGVSPNFRHPDWLHYDLAMDGVPIGTEPVELFDDGTHGDRLAGDGIYSRTGFTTVASVLPPSEIRGFTYVNALYLTLDGAEQEHLIGVSNDSGFRVVPGMGFGLGVLDRSFMVSSEQHGATLQTTSHVLNLVAPELAVRVAGTLVDTDEGYRFELAARLLALLSEPVDFIYLMTEERIFTSRQGMNLPIQNDVEGIGLTLRQVPDELGPLQALILLNLREESPIGHETMHRWGVGLDASFGFDTATSHWGFAGTYGVLGGFDTDTFVDHGDGTFTLEMFSGAGNDWTTTPLSDIELYLMGLMAPEDVAPIPVLSEWQTLEVDADSGLLTGRATLNTVSMEDVIAVHGPRQPAYGEAQTEFRAAFVVLSSQLLDATELSYVHHHAESYGLETAEHGMSFAESTGGRARMDISLPLLAE